MHDNGSGLVGQPVVLQPPPRDMLFSVQRSAPSTCTTMSSAPSSAAPWVRAVYVLWAAVAVVYSVWAVRMVYLARSSSGGESTRETLLHLEAWSAVGYGWLLTALTAAALGLLAYRGWLVTQRQQKRDATHTSAATEPTPAASAAPLLGASK